MQDRSTTPASAPARPSTAHLLFFCALAAIAVYFTHPGYLKDWGEDLPVYKGAVEDWLAGRSPYHLSFDEHYFLYPPFFLWVAGGLSHLLPANWGLPAYVALHLAAIAALPLALARYIFRRAWLSPLFALLLFWASPRFPAIDALFDCNIASLLYCLAFLGAAPGIKRNRWEWFYLAVILAAMIKITFLGLLLLPLLVGRRQRWKSLACASVVVAGNLAELLLCPALYAGYRESVRIGILDLGTYGYGVFGIVATVERHRMDGVGLAPYVAYALVAGAILVLLVLLRRRMAETDDLAANSGWVALAVAAAILVNPRVLQYDMDVSLFAAYMLWIYALRTRRVLFWMTVFFLPSLAMPHIVQNPRMRGLYSTVQLLTAFGFVCWRIWRETGSEAVNEHPQPENAAAAAAELKPAFEA